MIKHGDLHTIKKETDCNCEHCSKLIQFIHDSNKYQYFIATNISRPAWTSLKGHLNEIITHQIKLPLELSKGDNSQIIITKVKPSYAYYKE
ncbi:unnamed protein product [Didymodactylos carnosus]|uniref:Uncharacterized protein n=1 Tax=Didymodactylos carnosus TaxID=1234261 RepID=A0A816A6P2_9BILA|nr:unnamed protein product [Didymodactylos carnosus]CAF4463349.1 unnamed protein product [Didymodactylos carnosus]